MAVAVGCVGIAAGAGMLAAQEKDEVESRVRVLAFNQGSYLGVYIADVTAADVDRLGLPGERGVRITGVADEGPARDAGLLEDDVILEWNGARLESEAQLRRILGETPAGRSATLEVFRGGSERSVTVELGERGGFGRALRVPMQWNEEKAGELREHLELNREHLDDLRVRIREMPHVMMFGVRGGRLGVGIQSLEPQLAEYFGLGDRSGVLITTVKEDSPAAQAGLRAGDVILSVDGESIESAGDVSRLVWGAEAGPVAIRVVRDRSERTVTVELPEAESTWRFDDGEMNGLFFRSEPFDVEVEGFDSGEAHVEWAEPLRELTRLRIQEGLDRGITRAPSRIGISTRRSISI
jgi:membrane-associated protease RseP (regulator of RpoE activity)